MFHGSRPPSCDPPVEESYFTNSKDRKGNVSKYCLDVLHLKHNFVKKLGIPECIRTENLLNKIWYILTFPVPGRAPLPTSCSKSPLSFAYGKLRDEIHHFSTFVWISSFRNPFLSPQNLTLKVTACLRKLSVSSETLKELRSFPLDPSPVSWASGLSLGFRSYRETGCEEDN